MWVLIIQNSSGQLVHVLGFSTQANADAALANFKASKKKNGLTGQIVVIPAQDTTLPVSGGAAVPSAWQFPHSFNFS